MAERFGSRKRKFGDEAAGGVQAAGGDEAAGGVQAGGGDEAAGGIEAAGGDNLSNTQTWSNLPELLLEKIFCFLDLEDRYKMISVCRSWSAGLHFESLWECFEFTMRNRLPDQEDIENHFAERFGHVFQKLIIKSEEIKDTRIRRNWFRRLGDFLAILAPKSRITRLYFRHLCVGSLPHPNKPVTNPIQHNACSGIPNFLASNTKLEKLSFFRCFFKYSDATQVLKAAIEHNRGIKELILLGILEHKKIVSSPFEPMHPLILSLPDLESVVCDYHFIMRTPDDPFGLVELLSNRQKKLKLEIHLTITRELGDTVCLNSDQWETLRANPNLQVEIVIVCCASHYLRMFSYLERSIPLKSLYYSFDCANRDQEGELFACLEVNGCHETLRTLHLEYYQEVYNLEESFLVFIRNCTRLEYFKLQLPHARNGLWMLLLYLWVEKPEFLNRIEIDIFGLRSEIAFHAAIVMSQFLERLLRRVGINLEINLYEKRLYPYW